MYTQCPECQIAFRVTAKVLQQASGNVRCGNCSHAFNALHYLSEEMPESPIVEEDSTEDLSHDELAETSRRLLETLDELAGSEDVRIEDTGVEWRVLDEAVLDAAPVDQAATDEPRYDDNTPLPEDFGEEPVAAPLPVPERREQSHTDSTDVVEDRQGDIALSEPEDWTDILEEVRDPAQDSFEVEEELAAIHSELSAIDDALTDEVPQLEDDEFDDTPSAEGLGIEEIDIESVVDFELGDDEDTGVFEAGVKDEDAPDAPGKRDSTGEFDTANDMGERGNEDGEWREDSDQPGDDDAELQANEDEDDDEISLIESLELEAGGPDDWADEDQETIAANDGPEPESFADESAPEASDEEPAAFHDEPAAADAGEEQEEDVQDFTARLMGLENPEDLFDENAGDVETIIMEGEFVRSEIEKERIAAENAARSQLDDPVRLADTYAISRGKLRGGRRSYDPPSREMVAAIAFLGLLLVGQIVHNARESLATSGFFNRTIAPVYRLFGSPVTPAWDIRGWRFEATNGTVDEDETKLTIVSRIVNRSEEPLPYPLVHLSLTNRYEDVMGSRVLDPGEYLPGDLDPSQPVPPGENFTAVLEVEEPSPDATGFKLNVCYRVQPGTVRCAVEDFKD
jgi:predicted Zn finger-like uncharacterized protein